MKLFLLALWGLTIAWAIATLNLGASHPLEVGEVRETSAFLLIVLSVMYLLFRFIDTFDAINEPDPDSHDPDAPASADQPRP